MRKKQCGQAASEEKLDELIALANQLTCTGEGPGKLPLGGEQIAHIRILDNERVVVTGAGCPHCTWLAVFTWAKAAHEAQRNSTPPPPLPF